MTLGSRLFHIILLLSLGALISLFVEGLTSLTSVESIHLVFPYESFMC